MSIMPLRLGMFCNAKSIRLFLQIAITHEYDSKVSDFTVRRF